MMFAFQALSEAFLLKESFVDENAAYPSGIRCVYLTSCFQETFNTNCNVTSFLFFNQLLCLTGRKTQDIGQMQPAINWEAVCGSNHHRKGTFNLYKILYLQDLAASLFLRTSREIKA